MRKTYKLVYNEENLLVDIVDKVYSLIENIVMDDDQIPKNGELTIILKYKENEE